MTTKHWTDTVLACEHNWQACWQCLGDGKAFKQKETTKRMNDCTINIKLQDNEPDTYGIEIIKCCGVGKPASEARFWFKAVSLSDVAACLFSGLIFISQYAGDRLDERMRLDGWVPF
jgi:hypothetical protein